MDSPSRSHKRARIPDEQPHDISYTCPASHEGDSPHSELASVSNHAPGSSAQTPDQVFAIPPLPNSQDLPYAGQSRKMNASSYPSPQALFDEHTRSSQVSSSTGSRPKKTLLPAEKPIAATARSAPSSSFRNVSACNRCRLRKNRCDQQLPACRACEKAGVKCVGFDPFLGREVPRSYVYYLETRITYLEGVLRDNRIDFLSAEGFALENSSDEGQARNDSAGQALVVTDVTAGHEGHHDTTQEKGNRASLGHHTEDAEEKKLDKLVSNVGMVSVQGTSDPRYLGSTSGISFARVVFAAVKSTVSRTLSDRGGGFRSDKSGPVLGAAAAGGASMRDSVFGLQTKPSFSAASFPEKELGLKLVHLYFEHANPQLPILHRGEFMAMFGRVYTHGHRRTPRESYMLNIVFAIGSGIILDSSTKKSESDDSRNDPRTSKKARLSNHQFQPEEYHSSAIVHLENFLGSNSAGDHFEWTGGGLEELQAVLLLAGFALLRPVAPGLWYIVGVGMRLAIDLGLHHEDGAEANNGDRAVNFSNSIGDGKLDPGSGIADGTEFGKRQWTRDLRRRLWWSVYSLDRLVSTCVGRPFGVTDQVVTTDFPSLLDDRYISTSGFSEPPESAAPSAKYVCHHYLRLRLLQSEILQVLQHQTAQRVHAGKAIEPNEFMYTKLQSPFLRQFSTFKQWRMDVDRRLWEWKESAPSQQQAGVQFSPLFFELNYWLVVIMLYRQGLATPTALAHEVNSLDDPLGSPAALQVSEEGDEEFIYLKIAEAGQRVLKLYRQLHRVHLVNYTYLSTHHLFMAGISFLYAIWHSTAVRSHLSLDDVDFTVLAATSVLNDLIDKCPPAEACKDAFDRMSKATIQMCMSTTGFGPQASQPVYKAPNPQMNQRMTTSNRPTAQNKPLQQSFQSNLSSIPATLAQSGRPSPRFDMSLEDLFDEHETKSQILNRPSNAIAGYWFPQLGQQVAEAQSQSVSQYGAGPQMEQQDLSAANSNIGNIDPLLQQVSPPQRQVSQFSSQLQQQQSQPQGQQEMYDQQMQQQYPMMTEFDTSFLDSFAVSGENMIEDPNLDLYGVGGLDGGVDLFNGFFFGNVNGNTVNSSGFEMLE